MHIEMAVTRVSGLDDSGTGMRVAIDFVDELAPDEGLLIGNTADGFLHVLSENRASGDYPAREFRVNGGALHQYVYAGPATTVYLAEIRPGHRLPVVSPDGERIVNVGRVKREKRTLTRIFTEAGVSVTLQDATSVHLRSDHPLGIRDIQIGDELAYLPTPGRATHLGTEIEEFVEEF